MSEQWATIHLVLWKQNSLTSQEIHDKVMDPTSSFQEELVKYLESMHMGEFYDGTMEDVKNKVEDDEKTPGYRDPTFTAPQIPPIACPLDDCTEHQCCLATVNWWIQFKSTVNELVWRSNRHSCTRGSCLQNKWKKCKARFPRLLFRQTVVDSQTARLNMKKGEAMINTFTPVLTYLL
jgi:hypothetical protein